MDAEFLEAEWADDGDHGWASGGPLGRLLEVGDHDGAAFASAEDAGLLDDGGGGFLEAVAGAVRAGVGFDDDDGVAAFADFVICGIFDDFVCLFGSVLGGI